MSYEWHAGSDAGPGLAIAMLILAGLGAAMMIAGALEPTAGWGFAVALIAGAVAIWTIHTMPS